MAFEPMAVLMAFAAAILDSGVRIGNRCKLFPGFGPGRASILDFKPRLKNHCSTRAKTRGKSCSDSQVWA